MLIGLGNSTQFEGYSLANLSPTVAHVRRSRTLKLMDPNMGFEYSGRSALIGSFDYSGP